MFYDPVTLAACREPALCHAEETVLKPTRGPFDAPLPPSEKGQYMEWTTDVFIMLVGRLVGDSHHDLIPGCFLSPEEKSYKAASCGLEFHCCLHR